jgi:hypothetical protein
LEDFKDEEESAGNGIISVFGKSVLSMGWRAPLIVQGRIDVQQGLFRIKAVLMLAAIVATAMTVVIAALRMTYPFGLEFCEDGVLATVLRVLDGKPLYVAPSAAFVPFQYTPLYYYVGALFCRVLGNAFAPIRLLSFLCYLGVLALIALFMRAKIGRLNIGVVSAGLFAATFSVSGGWFDLGRVDLLFLFLLLSAFYVIDFGSSAVMTSVFAGLLLFLAYFSKQTASVMSAPVLLFLCATQPRRGLVITGVFGALVLLATGVENALSHGWYGFYTFSLLHEHQWTFGEGWNILFSDVLRPFPIAVPVAVGFFALRLWKQDCNWVEAAMLAGLIGGGGLSRLHQGGAPNSLLPAYIAIILCAVAGTARLLDWASRLPAPKAGPALLAIGLLASLQFLLLSYNPARYIPSNPDREAGMRLVAVIRQLKGDVFIPSNNALPALAGKPLFAHSVPIWDIERGKNKEAKKLLEDDLRRSFQEGRFSAAFLCSLLPYEKFTGDAFNRLRQTVFADPDVFVMPGDTKTHPGYVLVAPGAVEDRATLEKNLPIRLP